MQYASRTWRIVLLQEFFRRRGPAAGAGEFVFGRDVGFAAGRAGDGLRRWRSNRHFMDDFVRYSVCRTHVTEEHGGSQVTSAAIRVGIDGAAGADRRRSNS